MLGLVNPLNYMTAFTKLFTAFADVMDMTGKFMSAAFSMDFYKLGSASGKIISFIVE
jgi:hypothetical protein